MEREGRCKRRNKKRVELSDLQNISVGDSLNTLPVRLSLQYRNVHHPEISIWIQMGIKAIKEIKLISLSMI